MQNRTGNDRHNCPTWCQGASDDYDCDGEHRGVNIYGFVPATAGVGVGGSDGTTMDAIAAGLSWPERWGEGYSLVLEIAGAGDDRSVELKPSEALTFATGVVEMLERMVDDGVRIMFDAERVDELARRAEKIRSAHACRADATDAAKKGR